jgi:hypothetical protein
MTAPNKVGVHAAYVRNPDAQYLAGAGFVSTIEDIFFSFNVH